MRSTWRFAARRWYAGSVIVFLGAVASPSAVPVFDGVGTPDQPYRYVGRSPAPVAVSVTVPAPHGIVGNLQLSSQEIGPQVLLDLGAGALRSTKASLTVTASPLAPDPPPAGGTADGNAYRIAAPGGSLQPDISQGFLFLRAAVMTSPDPVIEHRTGPGQPWVKVKTVRAGRDIMSTPFRALGDYLVVRPAGAKPLSSGGLTGTRLLLLIGGGLLLLVPTVLVLRRAPADEDGPG